MAIACKCSSKENKNQIVSIRRANIDDGFYVFNHHIQGLQPTAVR